MKAPRLVAALYERRFGFRPSVSAVIDRRYRWDAVALVTLILVGSACHVTWERLTESGVLLTTVIVTGILAGWTWWLWNRVESRLTRFFCVVAILDLAAEGVLHRLHGATCTSRLMCELNLFTVYAVYLVLLRPLDVWLAARQSRRRTAG